MNVCAKEKTTGNIKKITIKNEKGRLSQAFMISDAEKFKAQDEEVRKKVEAKNSFEGYCFGVRNSLSKEEFVSTMSQDDKDFIIKEINDALAWIESHQDAEIAEYNSMQKELESKLMPIMQNAYQHTSYRNDPNDNQQNNTSNGPRVEEVD